VPTPARQLAFRLLHQASRDGPTLAELLAEPDVEALDARERAFLHELVLGTLRHRGALDHALAARADRPLARIEDDVLTALRLGAYQILRLRVPDRAAVAESVDLARSRQPRAAGFVNAVLRRLAREGAPPFPDAASDPLGWLTTEGSLPNWLAARWLARLGPTPAVARARALLAPPPAVYRLNPRRPDAAARAEAAGLAPRRLLVPGAWEATAGRPTELAADGTLYLQDQGSQLVAHLTAPGRLLLDACAAPGGKATLLADLVGSSGATVIAAEASPRRLGTLATLVARWGADNVRCVGADALRPPFRNTFDAILLDAPCSGLGTLARHPDIRWCARLDDLARHGRRQGQLLTALANLVAPGGRLVYATCSREPEENEDVVLPFLAARAEFEAAPLPDWAASFAGGHFARTSPEIHGGDAFFAAVLTRRR
jgi:16S rRNA (cytosine967-C5)-methyltransferase